MVNVRQKRNLEAAKARFLEATEDRDWMRAVGIGRVGEEIGLVISVRPRTKAAASRILNRLALGVPVEVRSIDEVRTRATLMRPAEAGSDSIDQLRAAARKRFGETSR